MDVTTVATLVEPAVVVSPDLAGERLVALVSDHPRATGLVVDLGDGDHALVPVAAVHRALLAGRREDVALGDLVAGPTRPLATRTLLVDAVAHALARPDDHREDDLLVKGRKVLGIVRLVRLLEAFASSLEDLASRDPLTGLPNRRHFTALLDDEVDGEHDVGLLFVDLDRFKPINDAHGHHVGDAVLREVGRRLRSCLRPSDVVARLGGDEFAVFVDGGSREACQLVADRVHEVFSDPVEHEGLALDVGASIGMAVGAWPDASTVLAAADESMYEAKRRGGGRVVASLAA